MVSLLFLFIRICKFLHYSFLSFEFSSFLELSILSISIMIRFQIKSEVDNIITPLPFVWGQKTVYHNKFAKSVENCKRIRNISLFDNKTWQNVNKSVQ